MASTLELLLLARMAGQPIGRVHATSAQTGILAATPLTFQAVDFDNMGGFNASGVYTVQAAGTYRCYAKAKMANTATNWCEMYIYKNGVLAVVGPTIPTTANGGVGVDVEDLIQCNVGDTLTVEIAAQATIATSIVNGGSQDVFFQVSLVAWS